MTESPKSAPLLKVEGLNAWYGESHILHGIDFEIGKGELVTLLGRNGAGKTTTLRSIMGIVEKRSGSVTFEGQQLVGHPSNVIARRGIAYCPEERGIFSSLNVEENLLLPPVVKPGGMSRGNLYFEFVIYCCRGWPGRVEDGRGGCAPFPVPAHQTGRADFPHPAFRLASSRTCRRRANVHPA